MGRRDGLRPLDWVGLRQRQRRRRGIVPFDVFVHREIRLRRHGINHVLVLAGVQRWVVPTGGTRPQRASNEATVASSPIIIGLPLVVALPRRSTTSPPSSE